MNTKVSVPIMVSVTYSGRIKVNVEKGFDELTLKKAVRDSSILPVDLDTSEIWDEDDLEVMFDPYFTVLPEFRINPDSNLVNRVTLAIADNNGYCISKNNKSKDKHCPCSDYLVDKVCHCNLYVKKK